MQKGDIAKLKLLLAGISARMTKNRDYFIRAVCTFTSGKKKFDAELSLDGQNWALRFQGSTSPTDAAAFCAFFASEAEKFDESVLVYYRAQRCRDALRYCTRRADEAGGA